MRLAAQDLGEQDMTVQQRRADVLDRAKQIRRSFDVFDATEYARLKKVWEPRGG